MEEPGRLHNMFDAFDSESSDPGMDWSEMGPEINLALDQKKKRKRRGIIYWLFGSVLFIGALAFIILYSGSGIGLKDDLVSIDSQSQLEMNDSKVLPTHNLDNARPAETSQKNINETSTEIDNQWENPKLTNQNGSINNLPKKNPSNPTLKEEATAESRAENRSQNTAQNSRSGYVNAYTNQETISKNPAVALPINKSKTKSTQLDYLARIEPILFHTPIYLPDAISIQPQIDIQLNKESNLTLLAFSGTSGNNLHQNYYTTSPLSGFNLDFLLQKNLRNGFFMESGVSLDQQRFQTTFEDTTSITLYKPNTIDTIYYYGENEEIIYTDSITGIGIRSFGHTNKITSVSIPLSLGYRIQLGKFSVQPQLGFGFEIFQKVDVRTPNSMLEVQSRSSSTELSFTPRYFGVFTVNYRMNSKASISARYRVTRQSIHPWNDEEKLYFTSQGLQVGLNYKI